MMTTQNKIGKQFNRFATSYEQYALVQKEIGQRLFERLALLKIAPRVILDLGCGAGLFSKQLKKRYPRAEIVSVDLAWNMLQACQSKQTWLSKWSLVNADMHHLPFATGVFDLIFSNQTLHWGSSFPAVFREINRVMRPEGCLMFSTLGPDTFLEFKQAWQGVDSFVHVNDFKDMHDIGDYLMAEYFIDPVVDMEHIVMHYPSLATLLQAIKNQGVKNVNPHRAKGLTGKRSWQLFEKGMTSLQIASGKFPLTYEVVYGHAWKGQTMRTSKGIETHIAIENLFNASAGK